MRILMPVCMLLAALLAMSAANVSAGPIGLGFDRLHTPAGGAILEIPGILPSGLLTIPLEGLPPAGPGTPDTVVQRLNDLPSGDTGTIQIEIVELSLQSIAPVDVSGNLFDVFVTLDPANPSLGNYQVTVHDDASGGGTFDAFFDVFVEIEFVEIGNPANSISQSGHFQATSSGTPWSHTPPPLYPPDPVIPHGDFHVTSQGIQFASGPLVQLLPLSMAVPEPASWVISCQAILLGLGCAVVRRRRSRDNRPR
jgi:hypothetical protein